MVRVGCDDASVVVWLGVEEKIELRVSEGGRSFLSRSRDGG